MEVASPVDLVNPVLSETWKESRAIIMQAVVSTINHFNLPGYPVVITSA